MARVIDIDDGMVFVVTDLHGEWEPYVQYRDRFLQLYQSDMAHRLVILGDLIHGYGPPEDDASLPMLLDVMDLQQQLGKEVVTMLLGNHELPHIYGLTLSKGDQLFTARFEHALGPDRDRVIRFLRSLPFFVRTSGGVMLTHAGAHEDVVSHAAVQSLTGFSHEELLEEADALLHQSEMQELLGKYLNWSEAEYMEMARYHLAVEGPDDSRYNDLLRGIIISEGFREFRALWQFLFNQCEQDTGLREYGRLLKRYLVAYMDDVHSNLSVLITGHMVTDGSYEIVAKRQLRLSSWAHARPKEAGGYLLFDAASPVRDASHLVSGVHGLYQ